MIYRDSRTLLEARGPRASVNGVEILQGIHQLSATLNLDGERIDGIAFQGESCAICKAPASMMAAIVKGRTRADAETLIQEFRDMALGKRDLNGHHHLGRLAVFAGVRAIAWSTPFL